MAGREYIVVGSGAGGGPLAARLAELGHSVLLLEAGGVDEPWSYRVPAFHGLATEDEAMRLDHYVRHYGDDDRQKRDPKYEDRHRGVLYPRARTLGGCTAHYAMIILRPHDGDWRAIADATGDASWGPAEMNRYFARVERCRYRDGSAGGHGRDGWLPTKFPDVLELATAAVGHHDTILGAIAAEAAVTFPITPPIGFPDPTVLLDPATAFDPNDLSVVTKNKTGLIAVPMAIDDKGARAGTRERIRAAMATGRLEVRTHCHVTRVLFDPKNPLKAIGVRYLQGPQLYRADRDPARCGRPAGDPQNVYADREVVLSAGAYITPQLLMLSGIGPRAALDRFDIDCRSDLPGVGGNLQDRYEVGIVAQAHEPFPLLAGATFTGPADGRAGDPLFERWRDDGKGLYATNGAVLGFIARSSHAERQEPDLFVLGVPGPFVGYYTGWSDEAVRAPHDKWTWLLLKGHTRYRGRVSLASKDPLEPPAVNFNYFERGPDGALTADAAADLGAMREGVKFVKRLIDHSKQLSLDSTTMNDVDLDTDDGIDQFVQDRAWGHHASCTCKIGGDGDRDAVLDASFRVRGVTGLRVVDASVFPKIPGFFIAMPTYMISEKAADVMHRDATAAAGARR